MIASQYNGLPVDRLLAGNPVPLATIRLHGDLTPLDAPSAVAIYRDGHFDSIAIERDTFERCERYCLYFNQLSRRRTPFVAVVQPLAIEFRTVG